jgi:threonine dehydrogenase-like Zn-dependent dehydrogenase
MRAVVTRPGANRAWATEIPDPKVLRVDDVVVDMVRVGVCGTDRHIIARPMGAGRGLPDGDDYLVIGHEAVGRVAHVQPGVGDLQVGDVVVPTVRRGCGECPACAVGQVDLCFSGKYRERGIVGMHGFLAERIVEREDYLIRVPQAMAAVAPLVESLTTPEKALRRIGNARAHLPVDAARLHSVRRALVTGSGPIALLAVLALRLRDIPTWVAARQPSEGLAARLVTRAGATYVPLQEVDLRQPQERLGAFDAIIEATGAAELSAATVLALGPNGVVDMVGGSFDRDAVSVPAWMFGSMVGRNLTLLGSVNANPDDWQAAVRDLEAMLTAFPGVVEGLITHTFGMADTDVAFERVPGQIKAVIDVARG